MTSPHSDTETTTNGPNDKKKQSNSTAVANSDEKPRRSNRDRNSIRLKGTAPFYRRLEILFFAPEESLAWRSISTNRLTIRRLYETPHIYEIENFLSESELQYFERFIETCPFQKSFVDNMRLQRTSQSTEGAAEDTDGDSSDPDESTSENNNKRKRQRRTFVDSSHRTSTFYEFKHRADPTIRTIEQRVADLLGCWIHQLESLQLVRYLPGEFFGVHHDLGELLENDEVLLPPKNLLVKRRLVTLFVYLNDLEENQGGETYFPKCDDLRVRPTKGKALVWSNITSNGSPEFDTIHAGEVVYESDGKQSAKYGLNIWVTEE